MIDRCQSIDKVHTVNGLQVSLSSLRSIIDRGVGSYIIESNEETNQDGQGNNGVNVDDVLH